MLLDNAFTMPRIVAFSAWQSPPEVSRPTLFIPFPAFPYVNLYAVLLYAEAYCLNKV